MTEEVREEETYVTKKYPTFEDWLAYNDDYFSFLRGENSSSNPKRATLVDIDILAGEKGLDVHEYFGQIEEKVRPLIGRAAFLLVNSGMDGAWHGVVVPEGE